MTHAIEIPFPTTAGYAVPPHRSLRVLCWVAGGPRIGMGHVLRSLELARALELAGLGIVGFVCNSDPCSVRAISQAGRPLWHDTDPNLPIKEVDVMLVDRPAGVGEIAELKSAHPRVGIAALDTFDLERSSADLIVNLINHHPTLRRPLAPEVRYHEGLEFAIVRQEFLNGRCILRDIPPRARNILVTFGGADPSNHTGLILDALAGEPLPGTIVRIVVGPNFSRAAEMVERARKLGLEVLERVERLAPWFAQADLAVSGGGTTMLELACTGTPTLVLPQNEAEARFATSLASADAVRLIRPDFSPNTIRRELESLIDDRSAREQMNRCALAAVDGLGQQRIAALLLSTFSTAHR